MDGGYTMEEKVLIIIPAYNEEESILNTYKTILEYNQIHTRQLSTIVINDGSKDKTEQILTENKIPHIQLIHNLGIGGAVQTGYKYAYENGFDIAIQFDGDGQHDITFVDALVAPIENGNANMTIGSRFVEGSTSEFKSTKARQMGIRMISGFIKFFTKVKLYDVTSGFRAIDKSLIKEFSMNYPTEYPEPISTTRVLKHGMKVAEVPVKMNERQVGTSSIHSWKNAYYMINVLMSIINIGIWRD